jgi:hypothetical protein
MDTRPGCCGWRICEPSPDLPCLISMMKNLVLGFALLAAAVAASQKTNAAEVVHGPRGTAVHAGGGTAVHTDHNWNDVYWHTNRYGYWHGQRGYWTVRGGKHVFVVVQ